MLNSGFKYRKRKRNQYSTLPKRLNKFQRYDREVDAGKTWENKVMRLSHDAIHLSDNVIHLPDNIRKESKLFGTIEAAFPNEQVGSNNGPLVLKLKLSGEKKKHYPEHNFPYKYKQSLTDFLLPAIRYNLRKT